jgi:hypothetical protein
VGVLGDEERAGNVRRRGGLVGLVDDLALDRDLGIGWDVKVGDLEGELDPAKRRVSGSSSLEAEVSELAYFSLPKVRRSSTSSFIGASLMSQTPLERNTSMNSGTSGRAAAVSTSYFCSAAIVAESAASPDTVVSQSTHAE